MFHRLIVERMPCYPYLALKNPTTESAAWGETRRPGIEYLRCIDVATRLSYRPIFHTEPPCSSGSNRWQGGS